MVERTDAVPPLVSVIVPVFNDAEGLARCLRALADQSGRQDRYEVLVVDNGSDRSPKRIVADFPRVRLTVEPRPGSYSARNRGIAESRGEILAFVDADCLPAPDWIRVGIETLRRRPEAAALGGRIQVTAVEPTRLGAVELHEILTAFDQRDFVERQHFAATANLVARRTAFATVGVFNDSLLSGGDVEWGRRLVGAGYRLVYVDDLRVVHPARRTWREMVTKQRRKAGGHFSVRPLLGTLPHQLARNFVSPIRGLHEHHAHPMLAGWRRRASFLAVDAIAGAVRNAELARLALGGEPLRG